MARIQYTVNFDGVSARQTPRAKSGLKKAVMEAAGQPTIILDAYADQTGSPPLNLALTSTLATAVQNYLTSLKYPPHKLLLRTRGHRIFERAGLPRERGPLAIGSNLTFDAGWDSRCGADVRVCAMRAGKSLSVSSADIRRLKAQVQDRNALQKHVWRAAIVLLTADGVGTNEIMRRTAKSKTCVWRWQERFIEEGFDGLLRDNTKGPAG